MPRMSVVAFGAAALLAVAASARAQDAQSDRPVHALSEIAPYVTSGGDATGVGATVRWPLRARLFLQAEGEYRNGHRELTRELPRSTGLNGNLVLVLDLPRLWRVTPFVVGGGGLEHRIDVVDGSTLADLRWRSGNSFVVNAGGGVRVALTDRVGVRVEVRYADGWADGAWDSVRLMYATTVGFGSR